jgi:polar amino acid transport system substrate-binding protein
MKTYMILIIILSVSSLASKGIKLEMVTCSWPPYYDTAKESKHKGDGVFAELTKAAFKRVGYDINVSYYPWSRAMHLTNTGKFPGLLGPYYSEERAKDLAFTDPVMNTENVFFAKNGRNIRWKTLKDLSKYKIGVGRGWAYGQEFDNASYLKKEAVTTVQMNIKKLAADRIDMFIGSKAVVLYEIENNLIKHIGDFEIVKPSYQVKPLHNAFSKKLKGYKKIIKDFNRGLKLIKKDGTYAKILKSYSYLRIGK